MGSIALVLLKPLLSLALVGCGLYVGSHIWRLKKLLAEPALDLPRVEDALIAARRAHSRSIGTFLALSMGVLLGHLVNWLFDVHLPELQIASLIQISAISMAPTYLLKRMLKDAAEKHGDARIRLERCLQQLEPSKIRERKWDPTRGAMSLPAVAETAGELSIRREDQGQVSIDRATSATR